MKNRDVVQSALRMLTVLDADESASAEDGALGLEQLNDLFALLSPDGIDLGYPPQDDLSEDFPLDDTTAAQIKPMLAVKLQAFYPQLQVSQAVAGQAALAMKQLRLRAVLDNIEEADLKNIPLGESNRVKASILTDE